MSLGSITAGAWTLTPRESSGGVHVDVTRDDAAATWADVVEAWESDAPLRAAQIRVLREVPYAAYFWETAPVRGRDAAGTPFAEVVIESPALARVRADPAPFREPLAEAGPDDVAVFDNLGGDATLVAPRARDAGVDAAHLAAFVRTAADAQVHALFTRVATATRARWARRPDAPLWVSTSGLGVAWLHVRLDDAPKYYTHRPFRDPP